ncbi:hypothetical protein H3U94_10480 [Bartonella sp. W8125]|uniref:hypothetical protein n=1 Tax=Bartonella TaxID=773 RepID=UPI0018DB15C0|nr:hypothetical protein [Bartonella choladocola]MBI0141295.1 hypothetical protein [Bartonella choladocola]
MDEQPFAISGVKEPEKIRILIYANNHTAHVPLSSLTKPLETRLEEIEKRLDKMGG